MDKISYAYADDAHDRITELERISTLYGKPISLTGDVVGSVLVGPDGSITIDTVLIGTAGDGNGGQLIVINNGTNVGWGLYGQNLDNFGDIGNKAINLSLSNELSSDNGATGDYSFAVGQNTRAKGSHSFASGKFNVGDPNTIVEVGIGVDTNNRANAFEIYADGKVLAPGLTDQKIIEGGDHSFVTKKYIDTLIIDCGLF